jgi:hypothetical protein
MGRREGLLGAREPTKESPADSPDPTGVRTLKTNGFRQPAPDDRDAPWNAAFSPGQADRAPIEFVTGVTTVGEFLRSQGHLPPRPRRHHRPRRRERGVDAR